MNSLQVVFRNSKVFLPVIHVRNEAHALPNARIAYDEGADGIFLINHRIPGYELLRVAHAAEKQFPQKWIGLNFLDLPPISALAAIGPRYDGIWMDDVGVSWPGTNGTHLRKRLCNTITWKKRDRTRSLLIFGGVAFKYRPEVEDVADAARTAATYIDVVTTSGPETGTPPSVEKIRTMRNAIGDHALAIASGMTPENVSAFTPYVDCFLVATGISTPDDNLDPLRVRAFREALDR